uniref:Uncharacterized protein n=1 Tax=Ditylenchus dipsaci TaxID=166011 RepID=A0A915CVB2_9BILA
MMAQMGQMAQGLGQDMKLQQNMLQNMLNGGASQLAADSLLALKHGKSFYRSFLNFSPMAIIGNNNNCSQQQTRPPSTTICRLCSMSKLVPVGGQCRKLVPMPVGRMSVFTDNTTNHFHNNNHTSNGSSNAITKPITNPCWNFMSRRQA